MSSSSGTSSARSGAIVHGAGSTSANRPKPIVKMRPDWAREMAIRFFHHLTIPAGINYVEAALAYRRP